MEVIFYGAGTLGSIAVNHCFATSRRIRFILETDKTKDDLKGIPVKSIRSVSVEDMIDAEIYVAMVHKHWNEVRIAIDKYLPWVDKKKIHYLSKAEMNVFLRIDEPINTNDFLRNTHPLGKNFGVWRGRPIDRYYIEGFLEKESNLLTSCGKTLEVGETTYSERYFPNAVHEVLKL